MAPSPRKPRSQRKPAAQPSPVRQAFRLNGGIGPLVVPTVVLGLAGGLFLSQLSTPSSDLPREGEGLVEIHLMPSAATVASGQAWRFTALGTYTDGSTRDLTGQLEWRVEQREVAVITSPGEAQGTAPGVAGVAASLPGSTVEGHAQLVVLLPGETGQKREPRDITGQLPHQGRIGLGDAYFQAGGLTPGKPYRVSLSGLTGNVNLLVYRNAGFDGLLACGSANPAAQGESCAALADDQGRLFIRVSGQESGGGSGYVLDVRPNSYQPEGRPGQPLALDAQALPHRGQVDASASHYLVEGLAPRQVVRVDLTGLEDDLTLFIPNPDDLWGPGFCGSGLRGSADRSCTAKADDQGHLWIRVGGDAAQRMGGSVFHLAVTPAETHASQGSEIAPIPLSADHLPFQGEAGAGRSHYVVEGLVPGRVYRVGAMAQGGQTNLSVFSDGFGSLLCGASAETSRGGTCRAVANASGQLYIRAESPSPMGSSFTLLVAEAGPAATRYEGSVNAPVALDASRGRRGQVDTSFSYYTLAGLTPGGYYQVRLDNPTGDANLFLYSDPFITPLCSSAKPGTQPEACRAHANPNGLLYVLAGGTQSGGGEYTLTAVPSAGGGSTTYQGSLSQPVDITGRTPFPGQVDATASYYVASGLSASRVYMVALTRRQGDVAYEVSADSFAAASCTGTAPAGADAQGCVTRAGAAGQVYLTTRAPSGGATYRVDVQEAPVSEGAPGYPAEITGRLPYRGGVMEQNSYYQVGGLVPHTAYLVKLSRMNGDVNLYVYLDPAFRQTACASTEWMDDQCLAETGETGELFVLADATWLDGLKAANFTLDVSPAPRPEGEASLPMDITQHLPYQGQVDNTFSHYIVEGLEPGREVQVSLESSEGALSLNAFSPHYRQLTCMANSATLPGAVCSVTVDDFGQVWLRVDGTATPYGAAFTLKVLP
ncbi:MAG: Ig-like domain-containing protein [Deltaproteobacteria bacterium]|nr:Ig-like domain-containing protein [Deltaproteobacteria bacterium]